METEKILNKQKNLELTQFCNLKGSSENQQL